MSSIYSAEQEDFINEYGFNEENLTNKEIASMNEEIPKSIEKEKLKKDTKEQNNISIEQFINQNIADIKLKIAKIEQDINELKNDIDFINQQLTENKDYYARHELYEDLKYDKAKINQLKELLKKSESQLNQYIDSLTPHKKR